VLIPEALARAGGLAAKSKPGENLIVTVLIVSAVAVLKIIWWITGVSLIILDVIESAT